MKFCRNLSLVYSVIRVDYVRTKRLNRILTEVDYIIVLIASQPRLMPKIFSEMFTANFVASHTSGSHSSGTGLVYEVLQWTSYSVHSPWCLMATGIRKSSVSGGSASIAVHSTKFTILKPTLLKDVLQHGRQHYVTPLWRHVKTLYRRMAEWSSKIRNGYRYIYIHIWVGNRYNYYSDNVIVHLEWIIVYNVGWEKDK